ncbi:non-specific serine/threonine protein kinase [Actinokineospora alba]|uniref:Non-specific serine/threonine protein kinase n=1 Tax=Actinokineospora alba TaxID=504798 RepID=A0A1H0HA81_9PSEU|nr:LuxR C-terminal-related transcriptional regulator [Actinokineospora alba]TDP64971.1 non-specific serine/threonine protein kinase [Actinokineospora alba]SDH50624.1 non-specific serine/threonine protein kinase [Actinokineospora alba]SDO15964.1 non-specific serine/threonine protein kinase [Actinokineospora alba]
MWTLPSELTSYIGRRREGTRARQLLAAGALLTLTGPGGVGKTRLGTRVMRDAARGFADGVVFVGLAELRDPALVANVVADRLGLGDRSTRLVTSTVVEHLRERSLLLVLDNCEHLVDGCAEFVREVLTGCPGVAVLATSRQSLGIAGERLFPVPPLSVPDDTGPCAPEELARYDSVCLFVDRAVAVWPTFGLTVENCADVVSLCRSLEGLPLAIELAAARIRSLSPGQIVERLARRLPLLTAGPRTAPQRQQTLRATIDWSHELCTEAEQALWARASVFAGSFDVSAAEFVCAGAGVDSAEVLNLVDALLDKSVLVRDTTDTDARYRMLETLREYGQERLAESGDHARVSRLHRDWFDRLTATADAEWASPDQLAWVTRLKHDHANLRAALDWCLTEPGEAGVALRMASRLDEYWSLRGFTTEARMWLDRALAATPEDHPDRPFALGVAALHALWQSDMDSAAGQLAQAENLGGDNAFLVTYLGYVRSLAALISLDLRTAELATAAAAGFRELGEVRRELHPLFIQGVALAYGGDIEGARAALDRMIELCESHGEKYHRAMAMFGVTMVEVDFGDVDRAAEAARKGLLADLAMDNSFGETFHLESMAWVADRQGDHPRAATLFGVAAPLWADLGTTPEAAVSMPHLFHRDNTRKALGDLAFDQAHAAGRAMSAAERRQYALGTEPAEPESPLTQREAEIAELVAEGMTNADIAAKLVIARRTADTHVGNILTKLGFSSRAQIAAWAVRRRR